MKTQTERSAVEIRQEELFELMSRQVHLLRDILGNMREEQQMLLENQTQNFKENMEKRELLLKSLLKFRSKHTLLVQQIAQIRNIEINIGPDESAILTQVVDINESYGPNIFTIREQMIALNGDMRRQTEQNNYLLENKISFTRELIRRLHPADYNPTYNPKGIYQGKAKSTTVTLINKEV